FTQVHSQSLSGEELLQKAIQYHDPSNAWLSFSDTLVVRMKMPKRGDRLSTIVMRLPAQYFELTATREGNTTRQVLNKDNCKLSLNGSAIFSEEEAKTHRLNCDRAKMMKDYYTYLYGLPMKLKDPGTLIDPKVQSKVFKGKEYLVLRVTYEAEVGGDIWYFYFDPATYAMEIYQFYHDESKNDGEYILLSGEEEISGIKMPKTRAWYYNKDDKYLGTDVLDKTSGF
ncbi:MAG: DUF6503 family protein, partial [Flavobacteriaceae bacterium]